MKLSEYTSSNLILTALDVADKTRAIETLVDIVASQGGVADRGALLRSILEREQQRTTGIGRGFAVPHAKCTAVPRLVVAFGRPIKPIDFAAIDGKPVQLIALLASPLSETSNHIQALAKLSRLVTNEKTLSALLAAPDAAAFYSIISETDKNM